MADRSRMYREVHVRICEGLGGVKFPRATRLNDRFLRPYNCCDIVFQQGQILFLGFAFFIFMIYGMNKSWLKDVLMARHLITLIKK